MKIVRWSAGACVAALALALNCGAASAQQKAPDAPKADAAKKVEPAKKAEPAKKVEAVKKPACNSLKEEAACTGAEGCQWVAASKTKAGKDIKAYCRTAPKPKAPAKKVEPAKKAEPAAAAKAPAAAPKAAAPAAPAAPKAAPKN